MISVDVKLCILTLAVLCLVTKHVECRRIKRNVFEFHEMVGVYTGRDPVDYYGYGNYCGYGGGGIVLDPIDECCREHDECYADQSYNGCHIFTPKYTWAFFEAEILCLDSPALYCKRHLCECDKAITRCLAENDVFYNPGNVRKIHSLAEKIDHFIEPIISLFSV